MDRLAVLPFENLTGDSSFDWIGPVLGRAIADELTASLDIRPVYVESPRAAASPAFTRVIHGYYTRTGDRVRASAVLRDAASQRNLRWLDASHGQIDTAALVNALAKGIDARTRPFGTQNASALEAWGRSMLTAETLPRAELLESALVSDPSFGTAYADLIQIRLAAGDREGALAAATRAGERIQTFTDLDRARVELLVAGLRGDQEQRRKALAALTRLLSNDLDSLRSLGDLETSARRFDSAVEAYRNAVALEPENAALLNLLGYAESYNGNLSAARNALERYRAADPEGLNPLDSLGEVHFFAGKFADAEKYFLEGARLQTGPAGAIELIKAAQARFLEGDVRSADEMYARYEEALKAAKNPLIELRRAQWLYVSGRQREAMALAQAEAANANAEVRAQALVQLALWKWDGGDRQGAADAAKAALADTRNPATQRIAALAQAVAGGGEAPEETASLARAYRALADRDFAGAAALLKPLYDGTPVAADGAVRTLYAWALAKSGKAEQARALLSRYYIPLGGGADPLLTTAAFPHFLRLRAELGLER